MSSRGAESSLLAEMASYGLHPPRIQWDTDKPQRFPYDDGKTKSKDRGWYMVHSDFPPSGAFGCWGVVEKVNWTYKDAKPENGVDLKEMRKEFRAKKKKRRLALEKEWAKAAERCEARYNRAPTASLRHPYLIRKGITDPKNIHQEKQTLLVPVKDAATGDFVSIQTINAAGAKRFAKDTRVHGARTTIGIRAFRRSQTLFICEGWCTGWAIWKATGEAVVIAFFADNLTPVAQTMRAKYPRAKIVVASDNDRWKKLNGEPNPGVILARRAAEAAECQLAIPEFEDLSDRPTDFCDLLLLEGAKRVRIWLDPAKAGEAVIVHRDPAPPAGDLRPQPEADEPPSEPLPHPSDSPRSVDDILTKAGILGLGEDPPMEDVEVAMRELRRLSDGVDPGRWSLIRSATAKALKKAKVHAPVKVVDCYLSVRWDEPEPEPEPPPDEADLLRVGSPILDAEDPLGLIRSRANEARYAGNTSALELLVLVVASRILDTPINALLKGPSAGGKSYTVECALQFHPHEAVHLLTSSSERALIYSDEDFQHRHIVIAEASGIQQDGVGATIMRELAWGGRGIRYETVEKVDGELRARVIEKPGPTGLITTSTRGLDKEMATRLLTVTIDDSPEQTKEILASLGAEAEDGGGSLWARLDFSGWHAAFRWMRHYGARDVQVPYARTLARMVTRGDVRLRRDFRQVLAVVRVSALISQRRRDRSGSGGVVADLHDYRVAYRLLCGALAISMDQVSTVIRETVENVATAVQGHPEEYGISVTALAKLMGTPKQTIHYRVTQALRAEFIANLETRKGHAAKLRPAEPLPEDRAVIPDPEKLRFAIEGGIPSQETPENDSDIGTPPKKAVPMLDEQPSQRLSEGGNRPIGTARRSDTYSDTPKASNEAANRHSVPMSERNPGKGEKGIGPSPALDPSTDGNERTYREARRAEEDEDAGFQRLELEAIRAEESTGDLFIEPDRISTEETVEGEL